MKTLIKNGLVIDPCNRVQARLNLLLQDGRVAAITESQPEADQVIDAAGRVVTPGFVDIHMHEDPVGPDGHLVRDDATAIFPCMLRMGVTTVLAGQCGINRADPGDYLDLIDRDGAAVNVACWRVTPICGRLAATWTSIPPSVRQSSPRWRLPLSGRWMRAALASPTASAMCRGLTGGNWSGPPPSAGGGTDYRRPHPQRRRRGL